MPPLLAQKELGRRGAINAFHATHDDNDLGIAQKNGRSDDDEPRKTQTQKAI